MNLADIFADTQKLYKSHPALIKACKFSHKEQQYIPENKKVSCNLHRFNFKVKVFVSKRRTFEAAEKYAKDKNKVAVLNFANWYNPGGGVIYGAKAQEECLCRISTLYDCLSSQEIHENFYMPHQKINNDLANDDIIYTPKVVVFKSDTNIPILRPESEWFYCDVITCAAPCLGWNENNISDGKLETLHTSRVRKILEVACNNEVDVLILGAFGCGAFSNPPEIVANTYKNVISKYLYAFKVIEFAIYCSEIEMKNFTVFNKILGNDEEFMLQEFYPKNKNISSPKIQAKIILAKCPYAYSKTENLFGMRIQKFGSDWKRTWAFKIDAELAHNEGYDKERTNGTFNPTPEYPGCPYCHSFNLAQCACGKSFCFKMEGESRSKTMKLTCPWCKQTGEYYSTEKLNLQGGGY